MCKVISSDIMSSLLSCNILNNVAACGTGFELVAMNLDGTGKLFSYPGQGIENCARECNNRKGCTGFEYNHAGNEKYKCATYTGGDSNLKTTGQSSSWTSCIRGTTIIICAKKRIYLKATI